MERSDLEKLFEKLDKASPPKLLSNQILRSFKPQLELSQSFIDQAEKLNKVIENTFPKHFFSLINRQVELLDKNTLFFLEHNRKTLENIAKTIVPSQLLMSQSLAITNSFTRQIMPQLNVYEEITKNLIPSQQMMSASLSEILNRDIFSLQNMIKRLDFSKITDQINFLRDSDFQLNFGQNVVKSINEINRQIEFEQAVDGLEFLLNKQISLNSVCL